MMYSDFHYRPPPPSYQASMQEYRLRLLLFDRQSGSHSAGTGTGGSGPCLAVEPPPNYRAHLRYVLNSDDGNENSPFFQFFILFIFHSNISEMQW